MSTIRTSFRGPGAAGALVLVATPADTAAVPVLRDGAGTPLLSADGVAVPPAPPWSPT